MFCPVIIQQKPLMVNGKGKGTCIVPQAATAAVAVLYVTDRAGLQPIGTLTYDGQQYAALICRSMVSTPACMNYYSFTDPKGMEG